MTDKITVEPWEIGDKADFFRVNLGLVPRVLILTTEEAEELYAHLGAALEDRLRRFDTPVASTEGEEL